MKEKREPITDAHLIGKTAGQVLTTDRQFNNLSVDMLLCRPSLAIALCQRVNKRLQRQLKHEVILQQLVNARKRGDLKTP